MKDQGYGPDAGEMAIKLSIQSSYYEAKLLVQKCIEQASDQTRGYWEQVYKHIQTLEATAEKKK